MKQTKIFESNVHDVLYDAARGMEHEGGSFCRSLAKAIYNADQFDALKIYNTWPELIDKYAAIGKRIRTGESMERQK